MQRLFRELQKRSVPSSQMDALEMFGGDGGRHTLDYQHLVRSLEIWEADPAYEAGLRKNLPRARIRMTDSFRELHATANSYDLIVIDCPGGLYGPEKRYCEHFEVFTPSLFRIFRDSVVVIVNVFPEPAAAFVGDLEVAENAARLREILSRRGAFYGTTHPELLLVEEMIATYRRVAFASGFNLEWHFSLRRTARSKASYLAMGLTRSR
jgi:hypothetical protein